MLTIGPEQYFQFEDDICNVSITPGDFLFGGAFFERYIVSFDFETQQVGFTDRLFR